MQALMTPAEFVNRAVGVPWVKWRSDWRGMDCFGCVVLWFREVLGVEVGPVPEMDIEAGFHSLPQWRECDPEAGATVWMAWRDGAPTHCGVLLDARRVLHAEGGEGKPGSVRISRLSALQRVYGEAKFYRYSTC
ncbi:NlpC/P60 family protein [Roseateles sp.]|uniref:NlpC/P60 family protein n=1 Tax=Roseateles sp. TaxID=1971397 RepID=UPI0031E39C8E